MRRAILALVISGAMVSVAADGFAAQRGNGGGSQTHAVKGAKTHAVKGSKTHAVKGPQTHAAKGSQTHAAKGAKTHAAKGSKAHAAKGAKTHAAKGAKTHAAKSDKATGTTGMLSPVQQKLTRNTNLARKLDTRLPAGLSVVDAASGFRNLGQFVAAVNVSNNLGIPFYQLKSRMVDDGMSLGQAIQNLRPSADYRAEVRRAERDAAILIDEYDDSGL